MNKLIATAVVLLTGFALGWLLRWQPRRPNRQEALPPLPNPGQQDPLDEVFGDQADRIPWLTLEEWEQLKNGGDPRGILPNPDFTGPYFMDQPEPLPTSDISEHRTCRRLPNGRWERFGAGRLPPCGELWLLEFELLDRVPACAGLNYAARYRATLLRAIAEAHRQCRERDPDCPNARLWMLIGYHTCTNDAAGPMVVVYFRFAVACVAA